MRKLKITVCYLNGRKDVHEVDHMITESVQWRLETGSTVLFIPMAVTRSVQMEERAS